jgi:hypothetical protein
MPAREPHERAEMLAKFAEKLSVGGGFLSLRRAYDVFKEIEAEMQAAEDDPELYNALSGIRVKLKEAMEVRARELGESESDHWAQAMKAHDEMLMLRPLLRLLDRDATPDDAQKYIDAYRALSPEQRDALCNTENIAGIHPPRPEAVEAEIRWNSVRLGSILRLVPDLRFGSWFERLKAVLIGLLLVAGLSLAVGSRSWVAALVCFVLLAVAVATWTRDMLYVVRCRKAQGLM